MSQSISTKLLTQSLLVGSFTLISIGNAIAGEVPTIPTATTANNITPAADLDLSKPTATSYSISQSLGSSAPSKANYVGVSLGFGDVGTLYGINSKFGISDSISLRPFVQFGSRTVSNGFASANLSLTAFGASATYDLNIPNSEFRPYAGIGYASISGTVSAGGQSFSGGSSGIYGEVGSDYNLSESIVVNANYKFLSGGGFFNIGGGFRF
jgi:opacity protein-like surface antigen